MAKSPVIAEAPAPPRLRPLGRGQPRIAHRPWWLWPHLLGLDAPVVALVWQDWWGKVFHVPTTSGERCVLGLGVWLIYLADRLADVSHGRLEETGTARHVFAAQARWPLRALAGSLAAVLTVLAPCVLPPAEFWSGLGLLGAVAAYFWLIHRGVAPGWTRWVPKEAVVGGMFAVGTTFFAARHLASAPEVLAVSGLLFGVICFLNCALITAWERSMPDRRDPASLLNAFPRLVNGGLVRLCGWTTLLALAAAMAGGTLLPVPIALAAGALVGLDRWRQRFSADALRCLVDVALLTPLVCEAFVSVQ